ncbi:MAG: family 78 glycoside hydrolase catalytic domain [Kiritimatiellae bacterium]|nr:family 78 glycoside hydrolase catalytic domain [Kiritimatiellia bacterium]
MRMKSVVCSALASVAGGMLFPGLDAAWAAGDRVAALDSAAWQVSEWISSPDAKVAGEAEKKAQRAADGTSWFYTEVANEAAVKAARWMVVGLGAFDIYVNGLPVGDDFLKPGFTHVTKTRRSFTYDVTAMMKTEAGAKNAFSAEVSSGWWRDKIVNYAGQKSAFRAVLEVEYADGTTKRYGTRVGVWKAAEGGPVTHAGIFDGEAYDARIPRPVDTPDQMKPAVANGEFTGEILPSEGAEVCLRKDLALSPVEAYCWKEVTGAAADVFGTVVKTRTFKKGEALSVKPGETLVVDFGQNAAAVPRFRMTAKAGTTLTCFPAEMLNEANGERSRGNDGPAGSVYRQNLRMPGQGMRLEYTFSDASADYFPRFTFFGYRYISVTADGDVTLTVESVPVTSITKEMETGRIETGVADVNKLISNVYWGQLSNYLSVPTDCPQRNERLGWTADTQVFTEAGTFNANTCRFFHKWMRDMRDTQHEKGGFPGVAPFGQYGSTEVMRLGWADAGVIVPYQVWKQFGDVKIIEENWAAMEKYMARCAETRYGHEAIKDECRNYQWADWLSYEPLESCGGKYATTVNGRRAPKPEALHYWDYLGACYWMWDAGMMRQMAVAKGNNFEAFKYLRMEKDAREYIREKFLNADGTFKLGILNTMQTPALFALKLGLLSDEAKARMAAALRKNIADHGECLQTGFLGTSILMDTLTENGMADVAYTLLLQHKNPSWLYSVDQGATTIWERWNSYRKDTGFGPVGMNSFNHYAYGAVLAWMYKTAAGIAADPAMPGFKRIIMAPKPDPRLGYVKAEYRSAAGLIKSAWRYEGGKWIWDFTVPEGATALVTLPGATASKSYGPGTHHIEQ